jgi:hypothetical protein
VVPWWFVPYSDFLSCCCCCACGLQGRSVQRPSNVTCYCFCSLGPRSFPQQLSGCAPSLFGYRPCPCCSCGKDFTFPSPTQGAGDKLQGQGECKPANSSPTLLLLSLWVQTELCCLQAVGPYMCPPGPQFPTSLGL